VTEVGWLVEAARTYRAAGFFGEYAELSDEELAARLQEAHRERWGEALGPTPEHPPLAEILVMANDPRRTWWEDTEDDVLPGNQAYERVLAQWADISLGSFHPDRVAERWTSPSGPVTLEVLAGKERLELQPRVREEWLDMGIVEQVNEMLQRLDSPRRFTTLDPGDQTAFVTCLSDDERRRIESDRGVAFGP
jgi:hypothetical protein